MTWVAAGVGAAATVISGAMGASSAKKGAAQQKKMQQKSLAQQKKMYQQTRQDLSPWMNRGNEAGNKLQYLLGMGTDVTYDQAIAEGRAAYGKGADKHMGEIVASANARVSAAEKAKADPNYGFLMQRFDNSKFEKDPGYQFRMDEGNRGIAAAQAARGGLLSGAAAKEASRYNQGFASNEYQNAYNRFTNDQEGMYNKLSGVSNTGLNAAGQLAQHNQQNASAQGQIYSNIGDSMSAGTIAQGNAWQGALGGLTNSFQGGLAQRRADNYANKQYDLDNRRLSLDEKRFKRGY